MAIHVALYCSHYLDSQDLRETRVDLTDCLSVAKSMVRRTETHTRRYEKVLTLLVVLSKRLLPRLAPPRCPPVPKNSNYAVQSGNVPQPFATFRSYCCLLCFG